jgi:hypothetical protein
MLRVEKNHVEGRGSMKNIMEYQQMVYRRNIGTY